MTDTPLLPLARRRGDPPAAPSADRAASDTMRQLVQLRWVAVCGQLLTIAAVAFGLGVPLPLWPMFGVAALLALGNLASLMLLARRRVGNVGIMLALLLDIAALTAQLYLSGGSTNPFIAFYLLQVVLGAILLERWSAWVLVVVTALCFAGLTARHVPLRLPPGLLADRADLFTLGAWTSFTLTATLLAVFITRITRNLRARDRNLSDLRQRAIEEDGIVRMGLFASGAAHELGTPLASLAVILSDWRRMPRLADDPELAGELAEMQAEVERCKRIVTDILHSAGEPRVEAMESIDPCRFLDEMVAAWRPTHPGVALDYGCAGLAGAAVVAGVSLRQAVWNVLDNAAEASPARVALHAAAEGEMLVLAITDDGPGFPEDRLATLGMPHQSRKGAGHGVGLFLTANVVRRLGGRLEAANRPGGGAEVRLVLPLAARRGEGT